MFLSGQQLIDGVKLGAVAQVLVHFPHLGPDAKGVVKKKKLVILVIVIHVIQGNFVCLVFVSSQRASLANPQLASKLTLFP